MVKTRRQAAESQQLQQNGEPKTMNADTSNNRRNNNKTFSKNYNDTEVSNKQSTLNSKGDGANLVIKNGLQNVEQDPEVDSSPDECPAVEKQPLTSVEEEDEVFLEPNNDASPLPIGFEEECEKWMKLVEERREDLKEALDENASKKVLKIPALSKMVEVGKENSPSVPRRSQRQKSTFRKNQAKSVTSPQQTRKTGKKQSKSVGSLVQAKLPFVAASSPEIEPKVECYVPEELQYLVTDECSPHYWRAVAENFEESLEDTLRANQFLRDKLTDLETENELLMDTVKAGKEVAIYALQNQSDDYFSEHGLTREQVQALINE